MRSSTPTPPKVAEPSDGDEPSDDERPVVLVFLLDDDPLVDALRQRGVLPLFSIGREGEGEGENGAGT